MTDYDSLSREKLVFHCLSYSEGMHQLRGHIQVLMASLDMVRRVLRQRGIADPSAEIMRKAPPICEGLGVDYL